MRRRQFTTLLARPRLICGQINPVHLIAVLSGIAWDKEKLERFIANPDEVVPGNRMKPYTRIERRQGEDRRLPGPIALTGGHFGADLDH